MTLDDLTELMRGCSVFNIDEIAYAIIETNGNLCVIKKSNCENVTREDLLNNPNGIITTNAYYLCEKGVNHPLAGAFCTGVIAIDGWEIKDDYPW